MYNYNTFSFIEIPFYILYRSTRNWFKSNDQKEHYYISKVTVMVIHMNKVVKLTHASDLRRKLARSKLKINEKKTAHYFKCVGH